MLNLQDEKIEKMIQDMLQKQYVKGIRVGTYTVSKIVYDKLNDKTKSLMGRINDVNKYVNVVVNNKDEFLGNSGEWLYEMDK